MTVRAVPAGPMRGGFVRAAVGLVVAVVAMAALLLGAGSAVAPASAAAPAQQGLTDLSACVVSRMKAGQTPTLRLAVIVDESGSLQQSDPGNARVTAAKLLIDQLAQQGSEQGFSIAALVAGFSIDVDHSTGFQPLTPATVAGFSSTIDAFAARNTGEDTDYWNAIQQIRTLFTDARGGADPAASPCQAVVLLTDGQFDLTVRNATKPYPGVENVPIDSEAAVKRVVAAGVTDLCRPAGPVDGLRADDITLIAVGLKGSQQQTPDFGLLQRMATGLPSACGAQPAQGAFFDASDVSDLLLIFGQLADPTGGGSEPVDPGGVCALGADVSSCPTAVHTFQLSNAFSTARLFAAVDADGIEILFSSKLRTLPPTAIAYNASTPKGSVVVDGVSLDYTWYSARAVAVTMRPNGSPNWEGPWTATFVDTTGKNPNAVSKTQLSVQPDLYVDADVTGGTGAKDKGLPRPGETNPFDFYLRNGANAKVTLPAGLTVVAQAVLTSKAKGAQPVTVANALTGADLVTPFMWKAPASLPVGPAILTITTTVSFSGTAYAPVVRQESVTVLAPFSAPSVAGEVRFPQGEGVKPVSAPLVVSAPAVGSGCVWVDGARLTSAPASVTSVRVSSSASSAASCLRLAAGAANRTLTLQLTPAAAGNGAVTGTLDVHLQPQGSGPASVVAVRFTGSLERQAKDSVLWTVFAVAMIIGIGLPILVYFLVRRRGARFPDRPMSFVIASVSVTGSQLRPGPETDRTLVVRESARQIVAGRYRARAVTGLRLSDGGHAEIEGPGVGIGDSPPYQREDRAVVALSLAGSWSVFVAAGSPIDGSQPVPGELLLVFPARASDDYLAQLRIRALQDFPARHAQFLASMRIPAVDPAVAQAEALRQLVGAGGDPATAERSGGWGTGAPGAGAPGAGPPPYAPPVPPAVPPPPAADSDSGGWWGSDPGGPGSR